MFIFMVRDVKRTAIRFTALLLTLAVLYFCLPPFYSKLSDTEGSEEDMTELKEPLRVEKEMDPDHLSAWFNSYAK